MGFFKQEYWSGLPCPPPGDLSDPGIKPESLTLLRWQVGSVPLVPPGKPNLMSLIPKMYYASHGRGPGCGPATTLLSM